MYASCEAALTSLRIYVVCANPAFVAQNYQVPKSRVLVCKMVVIQLDDRVFGMMMQNRDYDDQIFANAHTDLGLNFTHNIEEVFSRSKM